MQDAIFLQVLYKKHFTTKEAAENFINSHKRRDCFELSPGSWDLWRGWVVEKTRPATQQEINLLFDNLKK